MKSHTWERSGGLQEHHEPWGQGSQTLGTGTRRWKEKKLPLAVMHLTSWQGSGAGLAGSFHPLLLGKALGL